MSSVRLTLVGNGQPLTTFCPASRQDNSTVLRGHPDPESVGLFPAPSVGLVGALALHADPAVSDSGSSVARVPRDGTVNTSRGLRGVSTEGHRTAGRCVTVADSQLRSFGACDDGRNGGFGLFPKISTPVENTVENRALSGCLAQKT